MLNRLSATEFLNFEHGKFSKSNDRGVFGDHAMESGIPSEVSGCGRGVHCVAPHEHCFVLFFLRASGVALLLVGHSPGIRRRGLCLDRFCR
jgi:hypothetical protein